MIRRPLRAAAARIRAVLRAVDDGVGPPSAAGLPYSTGQLRALRDRPGSARP